MLSLRQNCFTKLSEYCAREHRTAIARARSKRIKKHHGPAKWNRFAGF